MKYRIVVSLLVLLCAAIALSGCAQQQNSSPSTTAATGTPSSGWSLTTSPTDVMPENIAVTVIVQPRDYTGPNPGSIPVVFNGAKELVLVKSVNAVLYRSDGQVISQSIDTNSESSVDLPGSKQTDRVVVYVTMMNGITYKVVDVLSPYLPPREAS